MIKKDIPKIGITKLFNIIVINNSLLSKTHRINISSVIIPIERYENLVCLLTVFLVLTTNM